MFFRELSFFLTSEQAAESHRENFTRQEFELERLAGIQQELRNIQEEKFESVSTSIQDQSAQFQVKLEEAKSEIRSKLDANEVERYP